MIPRCRKGPNWCSHPGALSAHRKKRGRPGVIPIHVVLRPAAAIAAFGSKLEFPRGRYRWPEPRSRASIQRIIFIVLSTCGSNGRLKAFIRYLVQPNVIVDLRRTRHRAAAAGGLGRCRGLATKLPP